MMTMLFKVFLLLSFFCFPYVIGIHCTHGHIRLVDGYDDTEGKVEMCNGGISINTICTKGWDSADATVVCRQLGKLTSAGALAIITGIPNTVYVGVSRLNCTGTESSILDCKFDTSGNSDCQMYEPAAWVKCLPESYESSFNCTSEGAIRLMGGRKPNEGRVEVCADSYWGTVCGANDWDDTDAGVVCKQLGYTGGRGYKNTLNHVFGSGIGNTIHYDDVNCTGSESQLIDCPRNQFISTTCTNVYDVGVSCDEPACTEIGAIRLGGTSFNGTAGTVEMCTRSGVSGPNAWYTICDHNWDDNDAKVVCKQLGFNGGTATTGASYGPGVGSVILRSYSCNGNEGKLTQCSYGPTIACISHNHVRDAGVTCYEPCNPGAVRLVNGLSKYEGRVEFCNSDGIWVTLYSEVNQASVWSTAEAVVVCKQLGHRGGLSIKSAYFGQGAGIISPSVISCTGKEKTIDDCSKTNITNVRNLKHRADANVICLYRPPCPCKDYTTMVICRHMQNKGYETLPVCKDFL